MAERSTGTTVLLPDDEHAPGSARKPRFGLGVKLAGSFVALILVIGVIMSFAGGKKSGGTAAAGATGSTGTTGSTNQGSGSGGTPVTAGVNPPAGAATPGTQTEVAGVPVGYAHTQAGAVAAATNFETARSTAAYFTDTATRHNVINTIMAPASVSSQTASDDSATSSVLNKLGISGPNSGLMVRSAPMGTKVSSYADSVATVQVWMVGVVGVTTTAQGLTPTASWETYTYTLTWTGTDWKTVSITAADGPTPLANAQTPTTVQQWSAIDGTYSAPPFVR